MKNLTQKLNFNLVDFLNDTHLFTVPPSHPPTGAHCQRCLDRGVIPLAWWPEYNSFKDFESNVLEWIYWNCINSRFQRSLKNHLSMSELQYLFKIYHLIIDTQLVSCDQCVEK